jgi:hypothetical protein
MRSVALSELGLMPTPGRGFVPAADSPSCANKKVSKEVAPEKPPLRGALRCSEPRDAPNSLRYAPFRQRGAKSELEACCARAPASCASRMFLREAPKQPNSQTRRPGVTGLFSHPPSEPAEKRSGLQPRAQHASSTDSAQLFDQSGAAGVLRGVARREHHRAARCEAKGRADRGRLFAFILVAQKEGRPPGRRPGMGLTANAIHPEAHPCL